MSFFMWNLKNMNTKLIWRPKININIGEGNLVDPSNPPKYQATISGA